MKAIKKVFSMLLAVVMILGLSVTAFAAEIDITNAVKGETYNAYKIFDVTNDGDAYAYTMSSSSPWKADIEGFKMTVAGVEKAVFTLTPSAADPTTLVVTWIDDFNTPDGAALLAAYLNGKLTGKTADGTATAAGNTAKITGLDAGYYFVDSSLGAMCVLNTAADTQEIEEKNTVPGLVMKVLEAGSGSWVDKADIDVSAPVKYQLTVTVGTGVDGDYVITGTLPDGVTYKADSLIVEGMTTPPTVTTNPDGSISFTLPLATLQADADKSIVITYEATASGLTADTDYTSTASLAYKAQTFEDTAEVITFDIGGKDVIKKVDGSGNVLTGVSFQLSKTVNDGGTDKTLYAQVTGNALTGWTEDKTQATTLATDADGAIAVTGLDSGSYILTETATLSGYNLLNDTISVEIAADGNVTYKLTSAAGAAAGAITIVNTAGAELPSTGGIGTTIFYVVGSILVIGAAVLLVTKKRMSGTVE